MNLLTRNFFLGYLSSAAFIDTKVITPPTLTLPDKRHKEQPQTASETLLTLRHEWAQDIRRTTTAYLQEGKYQDETESVTPASLVRLAFHDATTGNPNGSIRFELAWSENRALSRPLSVVQSIYEAHPFPNDNNASSLADTIALVAVQAIEYMGGPHIPIQLGRLDASQADPYYLETPLSMQTKRSRVTKTLPEAGLDSDGLRLYFGRLRLTEAEWVALSGIHGLGRHVSLLGMEKTCLKNLTRDCLEQAPVLLPFVTSSEGKFSNDYFTALLQWNAQRVQLGQVAFIPTDVAMVVDPGLRRYVHAYANNPSLYRKHFTRAMQKLLDQQATTIERF